MCSLRTTATKQPSKTAACSDLAKLKKQLISNFIYLFFVWMSCWKIVSELALFFFSFCFYQLFSLGTNEWKSKLSALLRTQWSVFSWRPFLMLLWAQCGRLLLSGECWEKIDGETWKGRGGGSERKAVGGMFETVCLSMGVVRLTHLSRWTKMLFKVWL